MTWIILLVLFVSAPNIISVTNAMTTTSTTNTTTTTPETYTTEMNQVVAATDMTLADFTEDLIAEEETHKWLASPEFPRPYLGGWHKVWRIHGPDNSVITLSFFFVDLGGTSSDCQQEYIEVYNGLEERGADRLERFCGKGTLHVQTNASSQMTVVFHTCRGCESTPHQGFLAVYVAKIPLNPLREYYKGWVFNLVALFVFAVSIAATATPDK